MGEGKAKAYLQKRTAEHALAELAEANGAPRNKAGKHTAPAAPAAPVAPDTAPAAAMGTRDIRDSPNED